MATKSFKVIPNRVAAECAASYTLTPEQLQFYSDNGYLVIKQLFGLPALNRYRQRFTDVCEGRVEKGRVLVLKDHSLRRNGAKPEEYINKIQELLYDEVFSTYSEDPRLLHIVSQLIGEDLTAIHCMLVNKPPGTPEHPPHQDLQFFPMRPADKIVASWTAIDPVTKENGCLFVVPGSQQANVLYEHSERADQKDRPFFYGIVNSEELSPENRRVYLIMEPGDTVFFSSLIVHGSRANVSKMYRKAMTCHYVNSHCQYIDVHATSQGQLAKHVEKELSKRGLNIAYNDIWRIRSKQVRGVKSNL